MYRKLKKVKKTGIYLYEFPFLCLIFLFHFQAVYVRRAFILDIIPENTEATLDMHSFLVEVQ